jgi:mannose-6-phosphate isomerase-like protein (cupin superfamily)
MARPGDVYERPGIRLEILKVEPEVLEMVATYEGSGDLPPKHHHPNQDEHFEVLEGRVRTVIAGESRSYGSGESFDVPAKTTHQMGGDGPAKIRWEVRPALRTAEFFEIAYAGTADENFLEEFKNEFVLD